jgi:hypothetical protein
MKSHKALNPPDVGLLGSVAQMSQSNALAYYSEQLRRIGVSGLHGNYIATSGRKFRDFWPRSPDLVIYLSWVDHQTAGIRRKIHKYLDRREK